MAQTHDVEIKGMKFKPGSVKVAAGDTVKWTNKDAMAHTVTADDGEYDSGTMSQNDTFAHTFTNAAVVSSYHCEFHSGMKAEIVVG